jgi:hypothetical protein
MESCFFVRVSDGDQKIFINRKTGKQILPLDLGLGRVFKIGRQNISLFVEPFWNLTHDGQSHEYGVMFGVMLPYPEFWKGR